MARTERESDRKRSGRLYGAAETSKELVQSRTLQRKNLNILGLLKRKEWPWCRRQTNPQTAAKAGAAFAKRRRNKAVSLEYQIMRGRRVKVGESRTLAREREIRAGAWRGKGGFNCEKKEDSKEERNSKQEEPR